MHKAPAQEAQKGRTEGAHEERELSAMEMSIICSNLARGCEKQYLFEEMEGFQKLAEFFEGKRSRRLPANVQAILERINGDLSERYPAASDAASMEPDRGALRALVWSEKVTRMLPVASCAVCDAGRQDAGEHRRICLYDLRFCLYRRHAAGALPGLQGSGMAV